MSAIRRPAKRLSDDDVTPEGDGRPARASIIFRAAVQAMGQAAVQATVRAAVQATVQAEVKGVAEGAAEGVDVALRRVAEIN